jgi:hypothetical protein
MRSFACSFPAIVAILLMLSGPASSHHSPEEASQLGPERTSVPTRQHSDQPPPWKKAWIIHVLAYDHNAAHSPASGSLLPTPAWTGESDQENARYGVSVNTAGDVNNDGYDDLIVGASGYDNIELNEGAAFFYFGSPEGPSDTHAWMIEGNEGAAIAGLSVASAGDVNGDGYDDVIVGARGLGEGGGARVFHGSPIGPSSVPDWEVVIDSPNSAAFGWAVASAGDANGDGYDDVIVGAPTYSKPTDPNQEGRAFVYHGSVDGLSTVPDWTTAGGQVNAKYGYSVNTAGDVDGDGFDEVIVGAWEYDNGETEEGRAYVYYGSESGLSTVPDWIFENNEIRACLGGSVGTAGDVNSDGYDDVVVGAAYNECWDGPSSPLGRAYGFYGSESGLGDVPDWIVELIQTGAVFGHPVATAGDVNSDGYDDVIVGALWYDNDQVDEGAAFLYLGSEAGLSTEIAWMVEGDQANCEFGRSMAKAGDVNGSDVGDVIIGAKKYDNGQEDEGAAFLYLGVADVPAGWVATDTPLLLDKASEVRIQLTWGPSCMAGDIDYEVYEGDLGDFASHAPQTCSTGGMTETMFAPDSGDTYYLIVPTSTTSEGSHGRSSDGMERSQGADPCLRQVIGVCD